MPIATGGSAAPGACPPPWTCADLGGPPLPGGHALVGSTWTITGSGDVYGPADDVHYVYQSASGDLTATIRVTAQTNVAPYAKAGVLLRASADPSAPAYYVEKNAGDPSVSVGWRSTQGGSLSYPLDPPASYPIWLRATRVGDIVTAYTSPDGVTWTQVAGSAITIAMPPTVLWGVAVANWEAATPEVATVDTIGATVAARQTTAYDPEGNAVRTTDADGNTTSSSYDPLGRLVAQTNPVSGTSLMTYTADELTAQSDPQGNVTAYAYDAAGRTTQTTNPVTGTTGLAYDAAGNTVAMTTTDRTAGNAVVTLDQMGYDALNRVITDTVVTNTANVAGSALTTLTRYDQDGNVAQTQQPSGDVVYTVYDAADQLRQVEIDPGAGGPLTKQQAATHAAYEAYAYDQAGNQTFAQDADTRATTTQYDGDNRAVQSVAASTAPTGTTTITTTLGYDPDGNTLRQTTQTSDSTSPGQTRTSTVTSAYNAADGETSSSVDGLTTSYTYDAAGQQIGTTTSDGQTATTLGDDPAGRVTSIAENAGGAGPYITRYGYNQDDLPTALTYPNNTSETAQYDPNSQLTNLTAAGPNTGVTTTTLQSAYAYGYNAAGWIVSTTTLSGTDTLTHDASGRLTDECGPQIVTPSHCDHWTYDTNGNLRSAIGDAGSTDVYTYTTAQTPGGQINEQVAGGSSNSPPTATIHLAYDTNGDTTSISNAVAQTPQPSDPGYKKYAIAESFAYDAQQRPITVTRLDSTKVGTATIVTPLTATLQYNADGLRSDFRLIPDPRTGKQPVDTRFAYRAGGELASATVTDITGTLLYKNTFIYGEYGQPVELIRTDPTGTSRYWYVLDGLGSVVALTSITGAVVDRYAYDSWGEETSNDATDETVPQQLRYQGYYDDEKLTWYWLDGRYYDPEAMRYLQPDPTGIDGLRTYLYAGDDPLDGIDVAGAACVPVHDFWSFVTAGGCAFVAFLVGDVQIEALSINSPPNSFHPEYYVYQEFIV